MVIVVGTFGGLILGLFVSLAWWSIDLLLGTQTLTENSVVGSIGISIVIANASIIGVIVFEEIRQ
jgi:hypothetical protein